MEREGRVDREVQEKTKSTTGKMGERNLGEKRRWITTEGKRERSCQQHLNHLTA
jgi:hypothetical protein